MESMKEEADKKNDIDTIPVLCSKRWIMGYMGILFGVCLFLLRADFSMALVCMSKTPELGTEGITNVTWMSNDGRNQTFPNSAFKIHTEGNTGCGVDGQELHIQNENAEFTWSKSLQSLMLSVYYVGCFVGHVPGGWLASRFGGKRLISTTMLLSAACTILMPVLARAQTYTILAVRIIMGLAAGAAIPAWFDLIGRWIPPLERSKFTAFLWIGNNFGIILAYASSGVLCEHSADNGWPSIFYVHGSLVVLFVACWQIIVCDSPHKHSRISQAELTYISTYVSVKTKEDSRDIPWKPILTSRQVWTLYISHICEGWTFFTLLTCLPLFLKDVLKLNVQKNGLFSSLPYATLMVSLFLSGYIADLVQSKGMLSTTATRRTFQVTAFLGAGSSVVVSGFATCEQVVLVIISVCACHFFIGMGQAAGYCPNHVDIAPKYGGIIYAVSNTLAQIPGFVAPTLVGFLTPSGTSEEWRIVFYICAGLNLLGAILFGTSATAEVQSWSRSEIVITIEPDIQSKVDNFQLSSSDPCERTEAESIELQQSRNLL